MKDKFNVKALVGLIIASILIFPSINYAQKKKIRVAVKNASIRLKPDMESEIIYNPPLGSVFEVETQIGNWYEVKFSSKVGVLITGYIHKIYIKEVREVPTKKEVIQKPVKYKPKAKPGKTHFPRSEITFGPGFNLGYSLNKTISYSENISAGSLKSATETGEITQQLGKPLGFGVSYNLYLIGGFGMQLRFDYNSKSNFSKESLSSYNLVWSWTTTEPFEEDKDWNVEGNISLMAISCNFNYKIPGSRVFTPVFSGGVSYFTGKLKADTKRGYVYTWVSDNYRYIDYSDIPLKLSKSLRGFGLNFGGGTDIFFSSNLALNIDARYFIMKKIKEHWDVIPGTYKAIFHAEWAAIISEDDAETIKKKNIDSFELNPSFFKISLGFKLMF